MGHLFVHCLQFLIRDRRPLPTQHRSQIPKLHGALPTRCLVAYGRGGSTALERLKKKIERDGEIQVSVYDTWISTCIYT